MMHSVRLLQRDRLLQPLGPVRPDEQPQRFSSGTHLHSLQPQSCAMISQKSCLINADTPTMNVMVSPPP